MSQHMHVTPVKNFLFFAILFVASGLISGCRIAGGTTGTTSTGSATGGSTTETIGGTVSGLLGTGMVLENNGADDLSITGNGTFTFKTAVSGAYSVTIKTQPTTPTQNCSVVNGSGTAVRQRQQRPN